MKSLFLLFIFGGFLLQACAKGPADYYSEHGRGWAWYEVVTTKNKEQARRDASMPEFVMNQWQQTLQQALTKAIVYPTDSNIKHLQHIQQYLLKRSHYFANRWMMLLSSTMPGPETHLYQFDSPEVRNALQRIAKKVGLLFIYRGRCPYCEQQAAILLRLQRITGMTVVGITLDNVILPTFPRSYKMTEHHIPFSVSRVPTLMWLSSGTQLPHPFSDGFQSESAIINKLLTLQVGP